MLEFSQPIHMQSRSTLRYCYSFLNQIVSGMLKHSWLHGPQFNHAGIFSCQASRHNTGNAHRLPLFPRTPATSQATNTTRRLRHFADAVPSISHLTILALLLGKGETKRNVPWNFEKNTNLTGQTPASHLQQITGQKFHLPQSPT
jgi:hypothetical protein